MKSDRGQDFIEYEFNELPYMDAEGNELEYGIEIINKEFTLVPDQNAITMTEHNKAISGPDYTYLEKGIENASYLLLKKSVETFDMPLEVELYDYGETEETSIMSSPNELVRRIGALKLAQKDKKGNILDYFYIYDQDNAQSVIDPYLDKAFGCQKKPGGEEVYRLQISNLPKFNYKEEAYQYEVIGFSLEQEGSDNPKGQKISVTDEGITHIMLCWTSKYKTTTVHGKIEWNDNNNEFDTREGAITSLFSEGIRLTPNVKTAIDPIIRLYDRSCSSTENNLTTFYGEYPKYNLIGQEYREFRFSVPTNLSNGQYKVADNHTNDSFQYNLRLKTDLQIEFDESLLNSLGQQKPEELKVDVTGKVKGSDQPSTEAVTLVANHWLEDNPLILAGNESWRTVISYADNWNIDISKIDQYLAAVVGENQYSATASAKITRKISGELVLHIKVRCCQGSKAISGSIVWNDGGFSKDRAKIREVIQKAENNQMTITAYVDEQKTEEAPVRGYYPEWEGNYYTMMPAANFPVRIASGLLEYKLSDVKCDIPGYDLSLIDNSYDLLCTKLINISGNIYVEKDKELPAMTVKLLQNGKVIDSVKPVREQVGEYNYKYTYIFNDFPIADPQGNRYDYQVQAADVEAYSIKYADPDQDEVNGNLSEDIIISFNDTDHYYVKLPVELKLFGKSILDQKSYRFAVEGVIHEKKYKNEITLDSNNNFYGWFEVGDLLDEAGEYEFEIRQIPGDSDDVIYDKHVSKVKATVTYVEKKEGKYVTVEVLDEKADSSKPDTSIFENRPAALKIAFNHQAISRISDGMNPGKGTIDYALTMLDESGKENLLEKIRVEDQGIKLSEEKLVSFEHFKLDEEGTYTLYVTAQPHTASGWHYDTKKYPVTLSIDYKRENPIQLDYGKFASENTITHYYDAVQLAIPVRVNIAGSGEVATSDVFKFTATDKASGAVMGTQRTGAGDVCFVMHTYYAPCKKSYYITQEADEQNDRWIYDTKTWDYTVTVSKNEDGSLSLTNSETPVFVNKTNSQPIDIQVKWENDQKYQQYRPDQLEISVLRDDASVEKGVIPIKGDSQYQTKALPRYQMKSDGYRQAINYKIKLLTDLSEHYEVRVKGNAMDGFIVYCTYIPEITYKDIEISVKWEDEDDAAQARPAQAMVRLESENYKIGFPALKMTSSEGWTGKYEDVPLSYLDGEGDLRDIIYKVDAENIVSYKAKVEGSIEAGYYQITYTYASHVHKDCLTKVDAKTENCTEDGNLEYYVCSCGEWFEDESAMKRIEDHSSVIIKATGHTFIPEKWQSNEANHWHKCERCAAIASQERHISNGPATEDTAETCRICGYEMSPPKGHQHRLHLSRVDAHEPNCTQDGNKRYYQCECGALFEDSIAKEAIEDPKSVILPATGHDTEQKWTSDETGHWHICKKCNEILDFSEHESSGPATEDTSEICKICDYEISPPKKHEHTIVKLPAKAATCTKSGLTEGKKCSQCGEIILEQKIVKATGHKWSSWTVKKAATATLQGMQVRSCKNCKQEEKQKIACFRAVANSFGSNYVTIGWPKLEGATKYSVYYAECATYRFKKLKDTSTLSAKHTKLRNGKYYKYYVIAYKGKAILAKSNMVHCATKGGRITNVKKMYLNKKTITLKKGQTFQTKLKKTFYQPGLKLLIHQKDIYYSSKPAVAKVSSKGMITGVAKGSCIITVLDQSGKTAQISVTVK